ncbi:hypothetical protein ABIE65_003962 [Constrictibacter sp. MBR-5]|jgi:hypothetical protein
MASAYNAIVAALVGGDSMTPLAIHLKIIQYIDEGALRRLAAPPPMVNL